MTSARSPRRHPPPTARAAQARLRALANIERARVSAWFFKTGPGQYGEGDRFLGISVPDLRRESKAFENLVFSEIHKLLASPFHELRLLALLVLIRRRERANAVERQRIFRFYLTHRHGANNWDLVDASAPAIVGQHLFGKKTDLLTRLAASRSLWDRRIAIVATFAFLRRGRVAPTFAIVRRLLGDRNDLIHKAAGWMLREAGKHDPAALRRFLARHRSRMPRTMLRYAIERFSSSERRAWLAGSASAPRTQSLPKRS